MAEAMIAGHLESKLTSPPGIRVCDVSEDRRQDLSKKYKVHVSGSSNEVVAGARIVVLAVKPDDVSTALHSTSGEHLASPLLLSICAGVSITQLEHILKSLRVKGSKVVRAMPNTPCLAGAGAIGYCCNSNCQREDKNLVQKILSSFGIAIPLKEQKLTAVTGLSGSGPAYVYTFIEALADGGVLKGLPRDVARKLAAQTVFGAAKVVLDNPDVHTAELRNRVESPGGTTIAGTMALEVRGFRAAAMAAVAASADRSDEMENANTQG